MPVVAYAHSLPYLISPDGIPLPTLYLEMRAPGGHSTVHLPAVLDSGAAESLFDGAYLNPIGLDLFDGEPRPFQVMTGDRIEARRHRIEVAHDRLGRYELNLSFSTSTIGRNLLGRDFFNLVQIGFRERQLTVFFEPTP